MLFGDVNRKIWLHLFAEGGFWTSEEVAQAMEMPPKRVVDRLGKMARTNLVIARRDEARRRKVYGVTGMCNVPRGMTVAEVQA